MNYFLFDHLIFTQFLLAFLPVKEADMPLKDEMILLSDVEETVLLSLYCKAIESQPENLIMIKAARRDCMRSYKE